MAYAPAAIAPTALEFTQSPPQVRAKPGLFSRVFQAMQAMQAARMRQAEREVARYLSDTGGKFTDEAEREIERRFLSSPSRW